jgi:predicted SprT family Zn-dependent metalloprotease
MAVALMDAHGLGEWTFAFDSAVRRFGMCDRTARRITLSAPLVELNNEAEIRDTILHEIAHARSRGHHGRSWRREAERLGCRIRACYTGDIVTPTPPFVGECPRCGRISRSHRRTDVACRACCKRYNRDRYTAAFRLRWRRADAHQIQLPDVRRAVPQIAPEISRTNKAGQMAFDW